MSKKHLKSALKVNKGVNQPPSINPYFQLKKKNKIQSPEYYIEGILKKDLTVLSQAITIIESNLKEHRPTAREIIQKCLSHSGNSFRIGITGVPGVGKSTFIEYFGQLITQKNHKVAVLAVDPSSERSKGSILGDKTRMESLSVNPNAFIRPSPSGCTLGGVARRTRESIILCEAAGFDIILIETVGVGQSETVVYNMVDMFLLLMLAGAGDELQGIKRGIMEMADIVAITKADGDNMRKCELAANEYKNALNYLPLPESGWKPQVCVCSSITGYGMNQLWETIDNYLTFTKSNKSFFERRKHQAKHWMYETLFDLMKEHFFSYQKVQKMIKSYEEKVILNMINPIEAAEDILNTYYENLTKK